MPAKTVLSGIAMRNFTRFPEIPDAATTDEPAGRELEVLRQLDPARLYTA